MVLVVTRSPARSRLDRRLDSASGIQNHARSERPVQDAAD
jgi:hypothetical protein